MFKCLTENQFDSLVAGTCGEEESSHFRAHIDGCATCRHRLRLEHAGVDALLRTLDRDPESHERGTSSGTGLDRDSFQDGVPWPVLDYEPVQECGRGAYGQVWVVRDRVRTLRALKIIDVERLSRLGVGCRERSALESYCQKVGHQPYLVTIHHVSTIDQYLYYTMDLADDRRKRKWTHDSFPSDYLPLTLRTIVKGKRLSPDVAIEVFRRILRGLSKLHELDLIHRDLKPDNILFVNRCPKIADIGLLTSNAETISAVGTPRYMPPDNVMDKTGDTYAIGKMLHEAIVGGYAPTFPALPDECQMKPSRWDLLKISDVIVRACRPTAPDRYDSASRMLEDIEACDVSAGSSPLFDQIEQSIDNTSLRPKRRLGWQLAFAFARNVPWVLLFIAVLILADQITAVIRDLIRNQP